MAPNRPIPPKLKEAHRLFEAGEYEKSAELFAELAEKAEARRIQQAPNLYLRSGDAWIKADDVVKAEEMIKKGLGLFVEHRRWMQLKRSAEATIEKLEVEKQDDLAKKIGEWVEARIPEEIKQQAVNRRKTTVEGQVKLPSNCGNCGGPVNPKEVEWYDAVNPICAFCGSVLSDE
jgi:hypothetical protein